MIGSATLGRPPPSPASKMGKTKKAAPVETVREYFQETSVHGFRDRDRTIRTILTVSSNSYENV